jgi:hypothetical protein
MNTFIAILILLIPVAVCYFEGWKLTPLVHMSVTLAFILLGYGELDADHGTNTLLTYSLAVACFLAGYFLPRAIKRGQKVDSDLTAATVHPKRSARSILIFVVIVSSLAIYHFVVQGIPFLSDNPEIARFDFASSGLFGIPGRMFLFGMPFCAIFVGLAAHRNLMPVSRKLLIGVWLIYVLTNIIGGFKGGLVNVLGLMFLMRTVSGKPITVIRMVGGWRLMVALLAVLYGAIVAFTYNTVSSQFQSFQDVIPYMTSRLTTGSAQPGYLALRRFGTEGSGGEQFGQDVRYFLDKYLGFAFSRGRGSEFLVPFEKEMSAAMTGESLTQSTFIVPVTVGAYPELVVNLGIPAACLGLFLSGFLFSDLQRRAQTSNNAFKSTVFAFAVFFLQMYVVNGDLMYDVFNFVLMSLLLSSIYYFCSVLFGSKSAASRHLYEIPPRGLNVVARTGGTRAGAIPGSLPLPMRGQTGRGRTWTQGKR